MSIIKGYNRGAPTPLLNLLKEYGWEVVSKDRDPPQLMPVGQPFFEPQGEDFIRVHFKINKTVELRTEKTPMPMCTGSALVRCHVDGFPFDIKVILPGIEE